MTGFLVVLGIGLVLLAIAVLRDRRSRMAATSQLGIDPRSLRRLTPGAPDEAQREHLDAFRAAHPRHALSPADAAFATWSEPAVVELADVDVLACPDGLGTMRELHPSLRAARAARRPLAVACPTIDPETLALLVGSAAATPPVVVLRGDAEACSELAAACGGIPADRVDLQSGIAHRLHGRASRLVCDATGCWVQGLDQA